MNKVESEDHPVWKEIQSFDTGDTTQSLTSFMVYMQLCEDKGWWNVKCHACEELSKVFLSGHPSRHQPRELVLPMSVDDTLSPADIQKYLKTIKLPDYPTHGLTLAIMAGGSTAVYYKVMDGMVPPEPPDVTEWKKYRREETPQLHRQHILDQTSQYTQHHQQQQQQQQHNT